MSPVELGIPRRRLRQGRLGKAARGELRSKLPVGFVYDEQGQVCLHPDAQVRKSIELLFETFGRTGSAGATVKTFGDASLLFPKTSSRGLDSADVLWKPLNLSTVVRILHNPRYAGAFVYGRTRSGRTAELQPTQAKVPREDWQVLSHHRACRPHHLGRA